MRSRCLSLLGIKISCIAECSRLHLVNGKLSIEVIFATRLKPCQWPFHSRLDGSKLNILYIIDEEQYHARSAELGVSSKLANTLWDGVRMMM